MPDYADAEFILEDGKYICGWAVEKMSKSMFNVVNPDDIIEQFGADTLRLYEMFLGPLEAHKPWDTQGIGIIRHPFSEGFCVQNVVLDDVDIYMDLGCFVLTFQTGRYIGIGPYDAVYEILT